jgi:hypothetical protein
VEGGNLQEMGARENVQADEVSLQSSQDWCPIESAGVAQFAMS